MEGCKENEKFRKYDAEYECSHQSHLDVECPTCGSHIECGHMSCYKKMIKMALIFLILGFLAIILFKKFESCSNRSWYYNMMQTQDQGRMLNY